MIDRTMTSWASRKGVAAAAFLALAATAGPAGADDAKPTPAAEEEARTHFTAGVNLVRDPARPRYEEAYAQFKRAYALVASPKILGNLGLCAMKLERDAEAIDAYTRYLAEAPELSAEERAQVERDLGTLKATLANVTVESRPAGATIIDTRVPVQGEPITNTHGPLHDRTTLGLRRGHHVMKARFEGGREAIWEADMNGGEAHVFELPPAEPVIAERPPVVVDTGRGERPIPTRVWVAGGVTAALGAGALVTGLVALGNHASFEDANRGDDPARADDLKRTGQTLNVVSDVLLVGMIVGAGVTAYFYFTRPSQPATASSTLQLRF